MGSPQSAIPEMNIVSSSLGDGKLTAKIICSFKNI